MNEVVIWSDDYPVPEGWVEVKPVCPMPPGCIAIARKEDVDGEEEEDL